MRVRIIPGSQNKATLINIMGAAAATRRGIRQGFFALGRDLTNQARRNITRGPKTGILYKTKGRARRRRASAAGEAPANRTGNLKRNTGFQLHGADQMEFGYRDGADYGKFLEDGTKNMAPRPNLGPVVDGSPNNAQAHFENALRKELLR